MGERRPDNLEVLYSGFGSENIDKLLKGPSFTVDGIEFVSGYSPESTAERFFIVKPPALVERYKELTEKARGGRIMELGIAEGGSTALLALWADPRTLVAIDNEPSRLEALDEFIAARGLGQRVHPHYGVDQADRDRLDEIVATDFDGPLDLVIDDASHDYDLTRVSFETLFPHLRPGGTYIIEDWTADIAMADAVALALSDPSSPRHAATKDAMKASIAAGTVGTTPRRTPMSRLAVEIMIMTAGQRRIVAEMTVNKSFVAVVRGEGELEPGSFRLDKMAADRVGLLPPKPTA